MISFTTAPNDQSLYYLGEIFGAVGQVLTVTSSAPLLGVMFNVINTAVLMIGVVIAIYITVVGLMKTAQEGEFLGKNWQKLWVPLRMVFGIMALFPMAGGYCVIQIIMMWIITQGVMVADTLWTTVLNYSNTAGSPTAKLTVAVGNASTNLDALFKAMVCQSAAHANYEDNFPASAKKNDGSRMGKIYFCNVYPDDPFCAPDYLDITKGNSYTPPTTSPAPPPKPYVYQMGPVRGGAGICGTLTYCNVDAACTATSDANSNSGPDSQLCAACKGQRDALQYIVTTIGTLSEVVTAADRGYIQFYGQATYPEDVTQLTDPTWLRNYCVAKLAPANPPIECCSWLSPVAGKNCTADTTIFPPYYAIQNGNNVYTSASTDLVQNLYAAYVAAPILKDLNITGTFTTYYQQQLLTANTDWISAHPNIGSTNATAPTAAPPGLNQGAGTTSNLPGWMQTASDNGWILAGSYYWALASMTGNNLKTASPDWSASFQSSMIGTDLESFRNNVLAASSLRCQIDNNCSSGASVGGAPPALSAAMSDQLTGSIGAFMDAVSPTPSGETPVNPLAKISAYGYMLIWVAQLIFAVFLYVAIPLIFVANLDPEVFGNGVHLGAAVTAIFFMFFPLVLTLCATMISFGGMLYLYIPMIPFVIFTMGAIGWMIGVIEAMVAAPFVALGIMAPGGHHELLGKAEKSIELTLYLLIRPSLMVFGMMTAMLFAVVVVQLVNTGFYYMLIKIPGGPRGILLGVNGSPDAITYIICLGLYVSILVTALNKCFSLIYHIPDRALTWIGMQAAGYGEEQALGGVKHGVEAAAGGAAGAAKGVSDKGGGALESGMSGAAKADTDKQNAKGAKAAGTGVQADKEGGGGGGTPNAGGGGGTPPKTPPKKPDANV